ncbi:hypothetical protein QWY82_12595 [Simiduia curdlanivorans]|uniref:Uncharacterized protein n=1 Tax=Simiduia curdlanivorans TaxID=1492769 RepID=A0ABV8VA65_9GAMM|nr:hypothetical protein [Simiduia curdlanivorans]MDN3639635.1 hypothetical protein [Simiduia curdlanivorans]
MDCIDDLIAKADSSINNAKMQIDRLQDLLHEIRSTKMSLGGGDVERHLESIAKSVNEIAASSLVSWWQSPLFLLLLGAFAAALAAYLFNWMHWRYARREEKIDATARVLAALLSEIEELSIKYWSASDVSSDEVIRQEIIIKSRFKLSISCCQKLESLSKKDRINQARRITSLTTEAFDVVTGGRFESKDRQVDKRVAAKSSTLLSAAISFSSTI